MPQTTPRRETANERVAGIIERTMRRQGFTGRTVVTHIRANKTGYSARVQAFAGTHSATYAARIDGRNVTVRKTSETRRVAGVAAPAARTTGSWDA